MDRRTFGKSFAVLLGLAVSLGLLGAVARGNDAPAELSNLESSDVVLYEGFEGKIPDLHTYRARYFADTAHAHTGVRSLRVAPENGSGGAYFRLDKVVDLESDYEFSAWVYAGKDGAARLYISASDGKERHTKATATVSRWPGGKAGEWVRLTGTLRGEEWRETDCDVMLALVSTGESWFDDVILRKTKLPQPPIDTYPALSRALRSEADRAAVTLAPGANVTLTAAHGVFATGFTSTDVEQPQEATVSLPPDGILMFAVDAPHAMYVTGTLRMVPDSDLRPGLRACVLCDDTVIATPMVRYAEGWEGVGNALTGPAPDCTGTRPADRTDLSTWLMRAGRHYIFVAAPHFRPGGRFEELHLRALDRPVQEPLYEFALLADTHLAPGRSLWMNYKLGGAAEVELAVTLASLRAEGVRFALIAGDMTDGGTRPQFEALGQICRASGLPVYGCIGNHDAYHASSRSDALELCADMFPSGATDYVLDQPPLRFIILDGSYWKNREGVFADYYAPETSGGGIGARPEQVEWLRRTLAADKNTPTVFVWHYPLYSRGGLSSCGYKLPVLGPSEVREALAAAPNVVAVLCGHTHWNEVNLDQGITHIVNPAYCEWPNAYRLFRVYHDRVEWELRQVQNRGFVRESFAAEKALSWMISTGEGDLGGEIGL